MWPADGATAPFLAPLKPILRLQGCAYQTPPSPPAQHAPAPAPYCGTHLSCSAVTNTSVDRAFQTAFSIPYPKRTLSQKRMLLYIMRLCQLRYLHVLHARSSIRPEVESKAKQARTCHCGPAIAVVSIGVYQGAIPPNASTATLLAAILANLSSSYVLNPRCTSLSCKPSGSSIAFPSLFN